MQSGNRLVLDTRNYNHRLLYLDLWEYADQIDPKWSSADSLRQFILSNRPRFVLRADFPQTDQAVFDATCGNLSANVGEVRYRLGKRLGIYGIYELDRSEF